jgi:hypothetical protein
MKLLKVKEQILDITWEHGKNTKLFAVVYDGFGSKRAVVAVFDSEYWANMFRNASNIKQNLTIMEVKR